MTKQYLPKLKTFVNNQTQWEAFEAAVDHAVSTHQRKLEQSTELLDLYHAQGAINALRQLKHLKGEVNAETTNK